VITRAAAILLLVAFVTGWILDRPREHAPLTLAGYRVLAGDFHTHSTTWSDGGLTPFGIVLEAGRQGSMWVAITGHNQVADAKAGRWFSALTGGPTVLVGQEIISPSRGAVPDHDLIAVGIESVVDWRQDIARQIADVHRQGGVAIAAHPFRGVWPAYDEAALQTLDGTEVCQPIAYITDQAHADLDAFATRTAATPIGSSDFHGLGRVGLCRTYVFATDNTAAAILAALKARRTVVYGVGGKAYGDPTLLRLADSVPRLRSDATMWLDRGGPLDWLNRICALLGMLALVLGRSAAGGRNVTWTSAASKRGSVKEDR